MAQATSNTSTGRKFYRRWDCQLQGHTEENQCNGNSVLLSTRPRQTRSLQDFLETRCHQLGWLFTKHHPPHHYRQMGPMYLHFTDHTYHDSSRVYYSGLWRSEKSRSNTWRKTQTRLLGQSHTGLETGFGKRLLSLKAVPTKPWFKLPG